jgi:hypothetical protein
MRSLLVFKFGRSVVDSADKTQNKRRAGTPAKHAHTRTYNSINVHVNLK